MVRIHRGHAILGVITSSAVTYFAGRRGDPISTGLAALVVLAWVISVWFGSAAARAEAQKQDVND